MYQNQFNQNKDLEALYYKSFIKIKASRDLINQAVDQEAYNVCNLYIDLIESNIDEKQITSAIYELKPFLIYLRYNLKSTKLGSDQHIIMRALIGVLINLKTILYQLHREINLIPILRLP